MNFLSEDMLAGLMKNALEKMKDEGCLSMVLQMDQNNEPEIIKYPYKVDERFEVAKNSLDKMKSICIEMETKIKGLETKVNDLENGK
jgi:uncharacterized protein YaaW (UPF0174 family)